jgi:hypothetical protein
VFLRWFTASALALVVCTPLQVLSAQDPDKKIVEKTERAPSSDLDAFMQKALARRDVNRKTLNDYILDEAETFEILGPSRTRLHRTKREYTWYVRDGMHVRSPVRFEGVSVGEQERDRYEQNWIRREKGRQERKAKADEEKQKETREIAITPGGIEMSSGVVPTEPRFVSEAYFMEFKFEPGNYYLAGREKLEGQDVLRIEYYPTRLFGGTDDEKTPRTLKKDEVRRGEREEKHLEQDIERKMNKTALVTLWVDPANHQIVKYTFDNVWLDFLPAAWLVRIDNMRASMTMFQPFAGVWLPRGINISAAVTLANGSFEAGYERSFSDYREADVKSKIRIPKMGTLNLTVSDRKYASLAAEGSIQRAGGPSDDSNADSPGPDLDYQQVSDKLSVPVSQVASEVIREIRVHGNVTVSDAEVLKAAGIALGTPLAQDSVREIERRLKDSGWFSTVEVRKRYRSLTDPSDVAIVLVVHEKATVTASPMTGVPERKISRWFTRRLMFMPILSYADGYGFTYGARFSTKDLLGFDERLSLPLTWGGTRRAALELERTFRGGPVTRVLSSAAIFQRENPRFEIDDRRIEFRGRAERNFRQVVHIGGEASQASIEFGDLDDKMWTVGADAALDTRGDPSFPGNAVYLFTGWTALNIDRLDRINRYTADARGYLRLFGQPVLAGRALYRMADAPLPPYERLLIGGSSSLRGFRTGAFDGDKTLSTSAELRIPITSVISGGKLGLTIFADAAKAVNHGESLSDVKWRRGAGGGVFLIASVVRLNLDVSHGVDGGGTRLHLSSGFAF